VEQCQYLYYLPFVKGWCQMVSIWNYLKGWSNPFLSIFPHTPLWPHRHCKYEMFKSHSNKNWWFAQGRLFIAYVVFITAQGTLLPNTSWVMGHMYRACLTISDLLSSGSWTIVNFIGIRSFTFNGFPLTGQ